MAVSENMRRFLEEAEKNASLKEKLRMANRTETLKIAGEAGFELTAQDIESAVQDQNGALPDDALADVAGGYTIRKGAHRNGWYIRLSDTEKEMMEDAGYSFETNIFYTRGDYFIVYRPDGREMTDSYAVEQTINNLKRKRGWI
jgi:predicted ribosomally synthesized peptide with nif11-like leader